MYLGLWLTTQTEVTCNIFQNLSVSIYAILGYISYFKSLVFFFFLDELKTLKPPNQTTGIFLIALHNFTAHYSSRYE